MKNILKNQKGFSLTEVMIGMMILTVAIVTGTNLLVNLIDSNKNIVSTLQAHYFAQEGIEAVRNIRDTNWLHNRHWLGKEAGVLWGDELRISSSAEDESNSEFYAIDVLSQGWKVFPTQTQKGKNRTALINDIAASSPWELVASVLSPDFGRIYRYDDGGDIYFSSVLLAGGEAKEFRRVISLRAVEDCEEEECENFVTLRSDVFWEDGGRTRNVFLETILTDWKGGVL